MGAFGTELGQGAATGAVGSATKGLFGALNSWIGSKINYKYNKKMMALQNQYAIEAFNRENDRQDYLMQQSQAINKQALRNAGYSTADPNGTGVSVPNVSDQNTPSPAGAQFYQTPDISGAFSDYANIKQAMKADYEMELLKAEANKTQTESEKLQADIKVALEMLPVNLDKVKADTAKLLADKEVSSNQAKKIDQETSNLAEVLRGIQIDNSWKDKNYGKDFEEKCKRIALLAIEGRIKEAEAKLADLGIVLGADGLATLIGVAAQGKAADVLPQLSEALGTLIGGLPAAIMTAFRAMWQEMTSGKKIDFKKIKDTFTSGDQVIKDNQEESNGENYAKKKDDEFRVAQDNDEYQKMSEYVYVHAHRDGDGNIDNDEWNYWRNRYYKEHK